MPFEILRDELRPYPGRVMLVTRKTLAATLTMLVIMTCRLPGAAIAGYCTVLLSRGSPVTTLRSAGEIFVAYALGAAYTLLGVLLFVDYQLTHFLWVLVSVFLCIYVIKATTNYVGARRLRSSSPSPSLFGIHHCPPARWSSPRSGLQAASAWVFSASSRLSTSSSALNSVMNCAADSSRAPLPSASSRVPLPTRPTRGVSPDSAKK